MTRVQTRMAAGAAAVYAPGAFDASVGRTVPVTVATVPLRRLDATLVAAEVVEDGAAALLTFELHDGGALGATSAAGLAIVREEREEWPRLG